MTYYLLTLISVLIINTSVNAQSIDSVTVWSVFGQVGNQGFHQSGVYGQISVEYEHMVALSYGYGNDFLATQTFTATYYFNKSDQRFYATVGYGYYSLIQKKEYGFFVHSYLLGFGFQNEFANHWVIGQEINLIKYLNQRFKTPDIEYNENYPWDDKIYFEIGVYLGYRFRW